MIQCLFVKKSYKLDFLKLVVVRVWNIYKYI